jgi:Tol biopolymer transport system component
MLAYDVALEAAYFIPGTGKPNASEARGIMALDADTGETNELVKPEHGLWLSAPHWSPDGNLLGFVEQTEYEGATPFAVYDFQNKVYHPWNQEIGNYAFAPDGQHIAYDRLSREGFAGNERIWVSDVQGKGEQAFSPGATPMAHGPAWSPRGDLLAYRLGEPASSPGHVGNLLVVQPAPGRAGEARRVGSFGYMGPLAWSPDGTRLAFKTGLYNEPAIKVVVVADGTVKDLGMGYDPAWQPSSVR